MACVVAPSMLIVPPAEIVTVPVPMFFTTKSWPVLMFVVGRVTVNVPLVKTVESAATTVYADVTVLMGLADPPLLTAVETRKSKVFVPLFCTDRMGVPELLPMV